MADSDVTLRPQQAGQGTNDVVLFPFSVTFFINVADSGGGSESSTETLLLSEVGSGAEIQSVLASFTVADVAVGVELFSKDFQVLETGFGGGRFAIRVLRSGRLQYTVRLSVTENVFDPGAYDPYAYE